MSNILEPSLTVSGLYCYRYDKAFFRGLDFTASPGNLLQIEGENGSGKTTLLKMLCGLIEIDEGEISWNGNNINSVMEEYRGELNYLGHKNGIKAGLTCLENLKVLSALGNQLSTYDYSEILSNYGLYGYDDIYAYTLSAGQKRRLSLARLSINKTRLWILDEPFTSLDEKGKKDLKVIFHEHLKADGIILLTSHDNIHWQDMNVTRISL
ncbi:MAG: cytochrome c biogenesis heme-transporting ATPase CcmA [Gammaproteobacteria bacterium]|nr:cytochrome c biogenesis heme-transporting ATPase CcmA [Gammaproteobacteria bacterium]